MRMKTLLVAAVMFFGVSAAAFAQATYTVGSTPVTAVVRSGQTEKTGDISFTHVIGSGTSVDGTITITYGVPITVAIDTPPIIVTGTGTYGTAPLPTVNSAASNGPGGVLVINIPAGKSGGSVRVSGVRVAVAGTALTSLNATISSTGNQITAGQTTVTVINSIAPGIASVTVDPQATIVSVTGAVTAGDCADTTCTATIKVKEGFLSAFGVTASSDPSQTGSTLVRITLSAAPPTGVSLTFHNTAGKFKIADCSDGKTFAAGATTITSTSTSLQVCYGVFADTDPTLLETLSIPVDVAADPSKVPLTAASLNVTATFAPIGTAFDSDGNVIASPIPRYAAEEVGPATLAVIVGANTTLLVPFATVVGSSGFDTGIAIANSTTDPGATDMGVKSAIPQSGKITFYFFPNGAPSFEYTTTAGSQGGGLDASGNLPSGSTYAVLLSQLLGAAGKSGDFTGYIFVITNFTNAHCLYVASNFTTFSQGSHALVISGDRSKTPESLDN